MAGFAGGLGAEQTGIDPLENAVKRKVGVGVHEELNSQEGTN